MLAVSVATRRLRAVARAPSPGLQQALRDAKKAPPDQRLARAVELTAEGTWEGDLARSVLASTDLRERVDAASEAVGDLAAVYGAMSRWTVASVRIVLFVGLILVAVGLASQAHLEAIAAFAVAGLGAVVAHQIGSQAARRETRQRELADGWVEAVVGHVPERKRRR